MVSIIHLIAFAGLLSLTHSQDREGEWQGTNTNWDYQPYLYADDYNTAFISKVCIKTDTNINHLKLEFSDGSLGDRDDTVNSGGEIGGGLESDPWQCFEVGTNECFVTINLRIGSLIDQMQVVTSEDRQSYVWGDEGGDAYNISARAGECISELMFRIDTTNALDRFRQIKGFFNDITWSPTSDPTISPSKTPSKTPSRNPTAQTIQPTTISPTNMPSITPTETPSSSPIQIPTVSPTDLPVAIVIPTTPLVQSIPPSYVPTVSPTGLPTVPTVIPVIATRSPSFVTYGTTATDGVAHTSSLTRGKNEGSIVEAPMGDLVYLFFGICVCIFMCACAWACHTRNKKIKPSFVIAKPPDHSQMTFVRSTSHNAQQHRAPSSADSIEDEEDNKKNEFVDEEERKRIKEWIEDVVKLPQHYETLIENGFDKMDFIMDISTKEDLREIGITLIGHQTRILSAIVKYKAAPNNDGNDVKEDLEGQINDKTETKAKFIREEHSSESTSVIGGGCTTERTDGNKYDASAVDDNGDQDVDNIKVSDVLNVELFDDKETIC